MFNLLDVVGLLGYTSLLIVTLNFLIFTKNKSSDIVLHLSLVVALLSLITYHYRSLIRNKTEYTDNIQKRLRLLGHATFGLAFVIILSNLTKVQWRYYDVFFLVGNIILCGSISLGGSQLVGATCLAIYFIMTVVQKIGSSAMDVLNFFGNLMLSILFISMAMTTNK